ncbi:PREDICTED: uncharacterized protein LOC108778686 [Cyphomyrmex costatus]|uniref:Uncharacterized protein n=1 Tax=Cyphomyrmex costatus TaxID=456900 RepID=A0A151IBV4_9HYME|nr:PREDICTED: uncharacterized protein LOC108778686 [Cyphomyrmex costatus]KYM97179.1 hypothetical protein ALC62_12125 [Cyphomyrmex costatus]
MLSKNFQVCCQILNNVTRNSLPVFDFSKKMSQNDKFIESENKTHLTFEQQKRLEQCSPSFVQICCQKLFSKSKPKCKTITTSDEYLKVRKSLKLHTKDLIKFVENESQLISDDIKSRLNSNRAARTTQSESLFKKTTEKLDELMKLDVSYGSWMRQKTLLLNDEIKRSFDAVERAIGPNEKRIASMLKKLRSDVSICIESAERNLAMCRKHYLPLDLTKCTKEQSDEATKMFDRMKEEARRKFKEIAEFRETILRAHEMTTQEAIEINNKKTTDLLRYLEKCIVQLKNSKK